MARPAAPCSTNDESLSSQRPSGSAEGDDQEFGVRCRASVPDAPTKMEPPGLTR